MRINKYILIAFIYFFFNSFFLPEGLLYTIILTPFFYFWLNGNKQNKVLTYFALGITPWLILHVFNEINYFYYFKTTVLLFTAYVFSYAFYYFINFKNGIYSIYKWLLISNFIATIIALLIRPTIFQDLLWHTKKLTVNITDVSRLSLLTYEPSYYSILLVPIVLFYIFKILLKPNSAIQSTFMAIAISLPIMLSFSFGVLAGLALAIVFTFAFFFKQLIKKKIVFYFFTIGVIGGPILLIIFILLFPDNLIFSRLIEMYEGNDQSAKGRTTEALWLSYKMAEYSNSWIGCGIGQMKVVAEAFIRDYYNYDVNDIHTIRIPSSTGETLATFGIIGLLIRIGVQIWLYVKTKVYLNYYRFSMFAFIFIYQFTGSFLTNIAEYVIWIIAFSNAFEEFNISKNTSSVVT